MTLDEYMNFAAKVTINIPETHRYIKKNKKQMIVIVNLYFMRSCGRAKTNKLQFFARYSHSSAKEVRWPVGLLMVRTPDEQTNAGSYRQND